MSAPEPSDAHGVSAGDVLSGKYRVDRVLGSGGMGVVVAATHLKLDHRVAIKMLLPGSLKKAHIVARFAREARRAAKLTSDHVVRVTDVDELPSGAPFMVMEYLEGADLADLLEARGPLPVAEAVEYTLQACEGIAEAHALGMVHRDLKPANLFLAKRRDKRSIVKLLDFGISKAEDGDGEELALTSTEMVIGSPRYMSPEQIKSSRDVDARTDIWSLGVILHQLLTATFPFDATSGHALAAQIASEPPIPIEKLRSDVPEALRAAIGRCLEKDKAKRFDGVVDLVRAIAELAPDVAPAERVARVTRAATESLGLGAMVSSERDVRKNVTADLDGERGSGSGAKLLAAVVAAPSGSLSDAGLAQSAVRESMTASGASGVRVALGVAGVFAIVVVGWFALRPPTPPPGLAAVGSSAPPPSAATQAPATTSVIAEPSSSSSPRAMLDASTAPSTTATTKPAVRPAAPPTPTTKDPLNVKPF